MSTAKKEILDRVADIEIKDGLNVISDLLLPIYTSAKEYCAQVEQLQTEIKNSNMRHALVPSKYKSETNKNQALIYANRTKDLIVQGTKLVYAIREKITGEQINFRTIVVGSKAQNTHIVTISVNELLDGDNLVTLSKNGNNVLRAGLTFMNKNIADYHQSQLNNLQESQNSDRSAYEPPYDWESSSKILYLAAIERWKEEKAKKSDDLVINRGHIFEYVDQINIIRRKSRQNGRRGVATFKPTLDEAVNEIFDNQSKLFDNISFIKGGDTLNAQNKLLNGTIMTIGGILNVFKGWNNAYGQYNGIIPVFERIINNQNTSSETIVDELTSLFTKKGEDLSNDVLKTGTEEAIDNAKKYIESYVISKRS